MAERANRNFAALPPAEAPERNGIEPAITGGGSKAAVEMEFEGAGAESAGPIIASWCSRQLWGGWLGAGGAGRPGDGLAWWWRHISGHGEWSAIADIRGNSQSKPQASVPALETM